MTDLRRAAERLLQALDDGWVQRDDLVAITLRQALAQPANQSDCGHKEYRPFCQMCMATKQKPEQEPVAWIKVWDEKKKKHVLMNYYPTQPSKPEHPLDIYERAYFAGKQDGIDETIALLKVKNT